MKRNIGWPKELFGDFEDFTEIDAYHEVSEVNKFTICHRV